MRSTSIFWGFFLVVGCGGTTDYTTFEPSPDDDPGERVQGLAPCFSDLSRLPSEPDGGYPKRGRVGLQCNLVVAEQPEYPDALEEVTEVIRALHDEIGCRPFTNILTESEAPPEVWDGDFPEDWGYTRLSLFTVRELRSARGQEEEKPGVTIVGDGYYIAWNDDLKGRIRVTSTDKNLVAHEVLHTLKLGHTEEGIMKAINPEWDFSLVPDICARLRSESTEDGSPKYSGIHPISTKSN